MLDIQPAMEEVPETGYRKRGPVRVAAGGKAEKLSGAGCRHHRIRTIGRNGGRHKFVTGHQPTPYPTFFGESQYS
jgi:hypothetical protein